MNNSQGKDNRPSTVLQAALTYARRGWPVFPCIAGKKKPACKNGHQDATTDESQIRAWFEHNPTCNLAIRCGGDSRLVVLDVDCKKADGYASLRELEAQHGPLPDTLQVLTPSGGIHFYFAKSQAADVRPKVGLAEGIDLRADDSYVLAPPSFVDGKAYAFEILHDLSMPLAPLPAWLFSKNGHKRVEPLPAVISKGQRNAILISFAGSMRRRGASEAAILAALREENARCVPPLPQRELESIARSAGRYQPSTGPAILTDSTNAELIAQLYGDRLRYDHRRGKWLLWCGHWWQDDVDGEVYRLATEAARHRFHESEALDLNERKRVSAWAIQSEQRARLESAIALAQKQRPIADNGKDWDFDPWLFAVSNGVIDLKTGRLRDGQQSDRITIRADVIYDAAAQCPRWLQFLPEIFGGDGDLINWLQRALGYSLTGDMSEQVIFVPWGPGANGKTVFLSTLRHVLGGYGYDSPFATFELTTRAAIPNDLAALEHRRLVTSSEINEGTRLNEARIKALSGGDPCTARYLHQEFFTFQPVAKIWLGVNHRPKIMDDSYGFWRRVRLIPFVRQFKGANADKTLAAKLAAEASGILNWLLAGCLEWQKRGLEPVPSAVVQRTQEYEAESDPLNQFLAEVCIQHPQAQVKASALYKNYLKWADEGSLREREKLSATAFGRRVSQKFEKKRLDVGIVYVGLGLSDDLNHTAMKGLLYSSEANTAKNNVFPLCNSLTRENMENHTEPYIPTLPNHPDADQDGDVDEPTTCCVCGGRADMTPVEDGKPTGYCESCAKARRPVENE